MRQEKSALVVEGYTDVLMLSQVGIKNAVATLGTAMTEGHLKSLSSYADTIHLLFDPDEAGEKALRRVEEMVRNSADLKVDVYVLRLSEDPADWLLEHPAEEFKELLSNSVPALEYVVRLMAECMRGASPAERSRSLSELREMVAAIKDPVFRNEAIRVVSESLRVDARSLSSVPKPEENGGGERATRRRTRNPLMEAGREVLAHAFARPGSAARAMTEGVEAPGILDAPFVLKLKDFADETQAHIYALLLEHAGEPPSALLSDERTRPMMDEVSALQAAGERLPDPSEASLRAAWFRLGALSRERSKARTDDFDEKFRLHTEAKRLERAAVEASNLTLES
ncbi:toprim domain-containing protein [Rubrobacter marinus]|uniref:Toprim domain-containing protein n=1 Tax=Rubrobacter marinus TaxID=2653852 RepID=A0A6G8PX74_9ACTN|nr:toprim domain-containing protein [Rubrobacter marinus]QIN78821.1 toprim domain-containing protein [Rubrobacter marinus]